MRTPRILWLVAALAAAVFIVAPRSSDAYRLIEAEPLDGTYCAGYLLECGDSAVFARWFNYRVQYWVNANAAADAADPGFPQSEIDAVAQACYQSWEDVPNSIIQFKYMGETTSRIAGLDGRSTTVWWNPTFDTTSCVGDMGVLSGVLAVTILTEIAQSGEITDADVVFDSADTWDWSTACTANDVQSVMTHEYGHSIGIHHSNLSGSPLSARPTMYAYYACDAGIASLRTLEADDRAAAQCLYPELPTVILVDQTGSMCTSTRMADTHTMANQFITDFSANLMAVAAFAEASGAACPPWGACSGRPGYQLLQNYTTTTALLTAAVSSTFPCGLTPLWESTCCAIQKAEEQEPSNLLIFTDTGENSSNGTCGCTTFSDVLAYALTTDVTVYVIDITGYGGPGPIASTGSEPPPIHPLDDSSDMATLAARTGGLYIHVTDLAHYLPAVQSVERHMLQTGHAQQHPVDCNPGPFPIDVIQSYAGMCVPGSPYAGTQVSINGKITVKRGTFDPAVMYVEDCSGGMQVFGTAGSPGALGRTVTVTGIVDQSSGEIRLNPIFNSVLGAPGELPSLPILDPGAGKICEFIGSLIKVRGYVGAPVSASRFPLVSALGGREPQILTVFIGGATGIDPASIHQGDNIVVTGVLTRRAPSNELRPRMPADIVPGLASDVPVATEPAPAASGAQISGIRSIEPVPTVRDATIHYELMGSGPVQLHVFDVEGRLLRSLVQESLPSGRYTARWDGRTEDGVRVASGIYYVRFTGPDGVADSREVLLIH